MKNCKNKLKSNETIRLCDFLMKANDFGMLFNEKHETKNNENQKNLIIYKAFFSHFLSF